MVMLRDLLKRLKAAGFWGTPSILYYRYKEITGFPVAPLEALRTLGNQSRVLMDTQDLEVPASYVYLLLSKQG